MADILVLEVDFIYASSVFSCPKHERKVLGTRDTLDDVVKIPPAGRMQNEARDHGRHKIARCVDEERLVGLFRGEKEPGKCLSV